MDHIFPFIVEKYRQDQRVASISAVWGSEQSNLLIDGFDLLLLIVSNENLNGSSVFHYIKEGRHIQERWISKVGLESWVMEGRNRNIIHWVLKGTHILDKDGYLAQMRQHLLSFEQQLRQQKLFVEFSLFLRRYMQSKEYLNQGHVLDAYSNILEALHHWARITIIESGNHPELTVWNQVYEINPGVYKLYEELTSSQETMEERVQLVLLACEFSVMSKMKDCCAYLFTVMRTRKQPWTANELKERLDQAHVYVEVALVLKMLLKRELVQQVVSMSTDMIDDYNETRYLPLTE